MALINKAKREINAKIIYYGRGGTGKSQSLRYIYDRLKPGLRGEFKTMSSMGDTLQFFDFTPFEAPVFGGYRLRFHVYTLTGRVTNSAAWKMTLKGADGIVLSTTASTTLLQDEQNSLSCLRECVGSYGLSLHDIPMVAQVAREGQNEHLQAEDICRALGLDHIPACLAQPATGEGVLETLSQLSQLVMARIGEETSLSGVSCQSCEPEQIEQSAQEPAQENVQYVSSPEYSVALSGEVLGTVSGRLAIPLQISVAGKIRRLVLTVSLAEE